MKNSLLLVLSTVSLFLSSPSAWGQTVLNKFKFTAPARGLLGQVVRNPRDKQGVLVFDPQPQAYDETIMKDTISNAGIDTFNVDHSRKRVFDITLASGGRNVKLIVRATKVRTVYLGPEALQSVMGTDKTLIAGVMIAGKITVDLVEEKTSNVDYKAILKEANSILTPLGAATSKASDILTLVTGIDAIKSQKNMNSKAHWEGKNLTFAVITMQVKTRSLVFNAKCFNYSIPDKVDAQYELPLGGATDGVQPEWGGTKIAPGRYAGTHKLQPYFLAYQRINQQGGLDIKNGNRELVVQTPATVRPKPAAGRVPVLGPNVIAIIPRTASGANGETWMGSRYLIDSKDIGNGSGKLVIYLDIKASTRKPDADIISITQGYSNNNGAWDTCLSYVEYYFKVD